jgi:hypothetical protein
MSDVNCGPVPAPEEDGGVEQMLQRVLELTRTMTKAASEGDFDRTMALMKERENVLLQASSLSRRGVKGTEGALLNAVQEENSRLMCTLQEKRSSIGGRGQLQLTGNEDTMAIKEILSGGLVPKEPVRKTGASSDSAKGAKASDRAQVSGEARSLYEADRSKKLDEIVNRLDSGYYDRQDVIEKIAERILKDFQNLPE